MNTGCHILLVEGDAILAEMLESAIELVDDSYRVTVVETPEEAMSRMNSDKFDAVVSEIKFETSTHGREFAAFLADHTPSLPFFLLVDGPVHGLPGRVKPKHIVTKPLQLVAFLERLRSVLDHEQQGYLRGVRLETLLQVLHQEGRTARLGVQDGSFSGDLFLRDGEIVHAVCAGRTGKKAVFEMLSWNNATVRLLQPGSGRPPITMHDRMEDLILQWCLQRDECAA